MCYGQYALHCPVRMHSSHVFLTNCDQFPSLQTSAFKRLHCLDRQYKRKRPSCSNPLLLGKTLSCITRFSLASVWLHKTKERPWNCNCEKLSSFLPEQSARSFPWNSNLPTPLWKTEKDTRLCRSGTPHLLRLLS